MPNRKRVYISDKAYYRLKELAVEHKEQLSRNKGMGGMVDLLLFGEPTSEGSGRPKKTYSAK